MSRKQRIYDALFNELTPELLLVDDESHNHDGPPHAETHYKVTAVAARFAPLTLLARHRLVNAILSTEFAKGLHALSMHLYTPLEWTNRAASVPRSPDCQHQ